MFNATDVIKCQPLSLSRRPDCPIKILMIYKIDFKTCI